MPAWAILLLLTLLRNSKYEQKTIAAIFGPQKDLGTGISESAILG